MLRRALPVALLTLGFVLVVACGRSSLDDLPTGGGTDASADVSPDRRDSGDGATGCDASTCPTGCCSATGECLSGSEFTACGTVGTACVDCGAQGWDFCDPGQKACGRTQPSCGPSNCTGCCQGDTCFNGTDPNACGGGGQVCDRCADFKLTCQGRRCVAEPCGPSNCKGCCFGDQCVAGVAPTECGTGGAVCDNCAAKSGVCQPTGVGGTCVTTTTCGPKTCPNGCCRNGVCEAGGDNKACGFGGGACADCLSAGQVCSGGKCVSTPLRCNPGNCPGCCINDVCAIGTQDGACGIGGAQCRNCTNVGQVCAGNRCQTPPPRCSAANCSGCCDGQGTCQAGFLNGQCGSGGASCINCSAQGTTCNAASLPRVCSTPQTQCPRAYAGCPGVPYPSPVTQRNVCSASDLANARVACGGGPQSSGCQAYLSFLATQRPGCLGCLKPFLASFQELSGIFSCAAPFLDPRCSNSVGCAMDCQQQSCAQCPAGQVSQCSANVRQGQCGSLFAQTSCVGQALFGPAAFCNPTSYTGSYGGWLEGVGRRYCGP